MRQGSVGGGLADLWDAAGHLVTRLGRDCGDASDTAVVLMAVPGASIGEALERLTGLEGKTLIDATNRIGVDAPEGFASNAEFVKSKTSGLTVRGRDGGLGDPTRDGDHQPPAGHPMRLHCAEVLSLAPAPRSQAEPGALPDVGTDQALSPGVKAVFIDVRVEGFFLERFDDCGESVGVTQHETMDEAMWQAYSEFVLADWRTCPEDVDPVAYLRTQRDG